MKIKTFGGFILGIVTLYAFTVQSGEKDLRPLFGEYGIGIYDQGKRGTCSVFALTGLIEFEYAKSTGVVTTLSVEYLNWASNLVTGEAEDGSFFSDAVAALHQHGICSDELFPYYIRNYTPKVAPSSEAIENAWQRKDFSVIWIKEWNPETGMTDDQVEQVKEQLLKDHPVAIGFQWPIEDERYRKMIDGVMYIPPREGVFDGHSVIIVGFRDDPDLPGGGCFIFKNSHGEESGDKGYGKMPYEYLKKYANDGVVIYPE